MPPSADRPPRRAGPRFTVGEPDEDARSAAKRGPSSTVQEREGAEHRTLYATRRSFRWAPSIGGNPPLAKNAIERRKCPAPVSDDEAFERLERFIRNS